MPKVTKRASAGEVNWVGELGIKLLPWNHSEKHRFPSVVGIIKCFASTRSWNCRKPLWRESYWSLVSQLSWCGQVQICTDGCISYLLILKSKHCWIAEIEVAKWRAYLTYSCTFGFVYPMAQPNDQGSVPRSTAAHWGVALTCWIIMEHVWMKPCVSRGREVMTVETDVQRFPELPWGNSKWMSLLKLSTGSIKGTLQNIILFLSVQTLDFSEIWMNLAIGLIFKAFTGIVGTSDYAIFYCGALPSRMLDVIFPVHRAQSRHLTWSRVFSLSENYSLCARVRFIYNR